MNRTSVDWTGPMPALTTPFRDDFTIDEAAFTSNVDRLFEAGATGMVVAGCTGEFWALSHAERARLARVAAAAGRGRGPVIVGTGAIREGEIVDQIHAAKEAGADGALVLPPYFVRLSDSELTRHFETVDAQSVLPLVLYNIPGNAGNAIRPELADRLADLDRVVAIKESGGDWTSFHDTLLRVRDRIRVFCGPSSVFGVAATLAGADGLIDCFPNVWAPGGLDLWHATRAGRMRDAWSLQRTGLALTELFTTGDRSLYPATKAAMDRLGLPGGGRPRPPLRPLEGEALRGLEAGLDRLLARQSEAA